MAYKIKVGIFLIVLGSVLVSCKEDKQLDQNFLIGKWTMHNALRNNQPTTTLENAYFEFLDGNIMKTNILGTEEEAKYEFMSETNSIRQSGRHLMEYQIKKLTPDSLSMESKIRNYQFQFFLVKS